MAAILVVDDAPEQLLLYKATLTKKGYQVTTAEGYHEGHAALRSGRFDLVVSDLCLNGQRGQGLLLAREAKGGAKPPTVLVLAAREDFKDHPGLQWDSVDHHTFKPVDRKRLLAAVNRAMKKRH